MPDIGISICSPGPELAGHWITLTRSAAANVFMTPTALNAAHVTGFAQIHVLLAWDRSVLPERLIGLWALREVRPTPLGPALLSAPPYNYAFLSNPVINPEFIDDVIPAFFNAIERERALPNIIRLRYLDGDSETYAAILKALIGRGGQALKLAERERPYASMDSGRKRAGSTRKKLRQDWNRLCAVGAVDIANERPPNAVRVAFETYLAMEAASWKGARGTALLCNTEDAIFARRLIGDLAAQGDASVALLRINGKPIAAQVLLYCGTTAYTWKTAFDPEFGKYSPGALLIEKMTERLFTDDGIAAIESCSPEGGFMNQLWDGRRATVDLLADVRPRKSLGFSAMVVGVRGYARLRDLRNRLRTVPWPALPRRRGLASSR
jgi:CelD/BcsL family acetyltransferase involved in cellulose biosynthesis